MTVRVRVTLRVRVTFIWNLSFDSHIILLLKRHISQHWVDESPRSHRLKRGLQPTL